jgi:hypothetical protein
MRCVWMYVVVVVLVSTAWAQTASPCACGSNPPGRPAPHSLKPYYFPRRPHFPPPWPAYPPTSTPHARPLPE